MAGSGPGGGLGCRKGHEEPPLIPKPIEPLSYWKWLQRWHMNNKETGSTGLR